MKRILKNNIFGFVISVIFLSCISIVVATSILSNNVSYQNNNQESVKDALDDIYSYATNKDRYVDINSVNLNGTGGKVSFVYWNDNFNSVTCTNSQVPTGTGLRGVYQSRETLVTAYGSNFADSQIYIKTTKVNETITGHTSCLYYNNREFCISPNYWTGTIGVEDDIEGTNTKVKLKNDMENALGITIADSSCYSEADSAKCDAGIFYCRAFSNGAVYCHAHFFYGGCTVYGSGNACCSRW